MIPASLRVNLADAAQYEQIPAALGCAPNDQGEMAGRVVRERRRIAPLVVHAAFAFMAESNLWPLLLILAAPFACLYLLALAGARALST